MLLSLLIGLLGAFLDYWFTKWLKSVFGVRYRYVRTLNHLRNTDRPDLAEGKAEFLSRVKWRFWYGPSRMDTASKLYDAAVARYNSGDPKYFVDLSSDAVTAYSDLSKRLVDGLGVT